jgi:uncharacterized protein (TIGR00730 family)
MGEVSRAALEGGAHVIGVIPRALVERELAFENVDELVMTETMHERKAIMAARAEAFVALPGGFGTFEEILEVITHRQLVFHTKPCVLVNQGGYYDPLIEMFERSFRELFTREKHRESYKVVATAAEALDYIESVISDQ